MECKALYMINEGKQLLEQAKKMKELLFPETQGGKMSDDWKSSKILMECDMDFLKGCLGKEDLNLKLIYRATKHGDSA